MRDGGIWFGRGLLAFAALCSCLACEEPEKPAKKIVPHAPTEEPETEPPPPPPTPPTFSIDEFGPKDRFSLAVVTDEEGKPRVQGLEQLRKDLAAEKEYISGKDILLTVGRKANPGWVTTYLAELATLAPSSVKVGTETRAEYPKEVAFALEGESTKVAGCTARKRGRGMGGPDLTMTGDTIVSMAKGCDSNLFVVSGAEGVEWGLIYDLAASAMTLEKAGLSRALVPKQRPTAGRPVKLDG